MARTRQFGRLVRLVRDLRSASGQENAAGRTWVELLARFRKDRRAWLRDVGGLSVMGLGLVSACQDPGPVFPLPEDADGGAEAEEPQEIGVAIIGGGMAGLHCAYRLKEAGVASEVFEAAKRVGGRMFTDRENYGDQVAELGGEFIDSDHTTLITLAEEFDIQLDDREADLDEDTVKDLWWIDGVAVPEATVVEQFAEVAPLMAELVQRIDVEGDDELFAELDATPMSDWLDENVPVASYPELHAILTNSYRGEYGLETSQQSVLNLLYLIGSDDPDPFRIFGDSDERFHTHRGSQTFIDELAAELKAEITLEHRLVAVSGKRGGPYTLRFEAPGGDVEVVATHVVFALPFTLLREVDTSDLALPEDKLEMIQEMGYGTNAKLIGSFRERVWRLEHDSSGSVTTDAAFQQCWDTSIGQAGEQGILTNFLGGTTGRDADDGEPEELYEAFVEQLEAAFPGVASAYQEGSAVRMHWPTYAFTKGSYACYTPGQWRFWSFEGRKVQNLHFCGEHTSLEYQGYMEGAAETGLRAATEVLDALGVVPTAIHRALVELRRGLPTLHENGVPRFLSRRKELRRRLLARA